MGTARGPDPRVPYIMADQAPKAAKKRPLTLEELRAGSATRIVKPNALPALSVVDKPTSKPRELTTMQIRVASYMAKGFSVSQAAKKFAKGICPHERNPKVQIRKARTRINRWGQTQAFRDAIWEYTLIGADLSSPAAVRGIARKAAAGRVDAARFLMELNGRHSPYAETTPAAINIIFNGIPRPEDPDVEYEGDEVEEVDSS